MATSGLSSKEICRIIAVCKKNKVGYFKFDTLELNFGPLEKSLERKERVVSHETSQISAKGRSVAESPELIFTPGEVEALEMAAESQMLIDDPLGHETAMIDRHLRRDGIRNARSS